MAKARTKGETVAVAGPARSIPSLREPRYLQSLKRGLAILGCFTSQRPMLGIAAIADELGMSRSSTHRYVITLVALGYLEQGASRKYRLGLRVTDLGMSALNSTDLREYSHPYLEELMYHTRYTVSLSVLDGPEIVYVARARSFHPRQSKIDLNLHLGSRLPAYCTSMGKILLAHLPKDEQQGHIAGISQLTKRGPKTITSKSALRRELTEVREAGFAFNDEELTADLYSIAVPVRNDTREVVAAVNMVAHSSMGSLEGLVDTLAHLFLTSDRISARLGYQHDT